MASGIFLGSSGAVHIARREGSNVGNVALRTTLTPSDVNEGQDLLSFDYLDFDIGQPPITTGDYIIIKRINVGGPFVAGQIQQPGAGYSDGTYTNQTLTVFDPANSGRTLQVDATVENGAFTVITPVAATTANPQIVQVGDRLTIDANLNAWAGTGPNLPVIYEVTRIDATTANQLILEEGVTDEVDLGAFANINQAAELSLYRDYDDAINGEERDRVGLVAHTTDQDIMVTIERTRERCLAQVKSFSIATSRELVTVTELGEQHQKQFEQGLIQGQGKLDCFWQYSNCMCEYSDVSELTFAQYLADICLRLNLGSSFHGFFFLHESPAEDQSSVWYECEQCIVSNVAIEVSPDEAVEASIDFVMSGPITLRSGCRPLLLALQNGGTLAGQQQNQITNLGIGWSCGQTPTPFPTPTPTPSPTPTPTPTPGPPFITITMPADWTTTSIGADYYDNIPGQCNGLNRSPAMSWSYSGTGTVHRWSLNLTDVLQAGGTFVHYDVTQIPSTTTSVLLNQTPVGGTVNANYKPTLEYAGPCPPASSGVHVYTWTVTAVDINGTQLATATFDTTITA